jgi:hypothetical protein
MTQIAPTLQAFFSDRLARAMLTWRSKPACGSPS